MHLRNLCLHDALQMKPFAADDILARCSLSVALDTFIRATKLLEESGQPEQAVLLMAAVIVDSYALYRGASLEQTLGVVRAIVMRWRSTDPPLIPPLSRN